MHKKIQDSTWKPFFLSAQDKAGKYGIYSPALVEKILQYERSRADRDGGCFSMVLFRLYSLDARAADLVETLKSGTRLIDHIGWYEADTVCVLLTGTRIYGAQLFLDKINAHIETQYSNGKRPVYSSEIYSYPNKEGCGPNGGGERDEEELPEKIYRQNELKIHEAIKCRISKKMPVWKRSLDIIGSATGLFLLAPLFCLIGFYIKLVSRGPVFFKQMRVGYKGCNFTFLKFRTMHSGNDEEFHNQHAHNFISHGNVPMDKLDEQDPRIIPGGKLLRKSCIDELPQLWNVLRGEMSLVGPRPCIPYEAEEYIRWHTQRFDIVPGITGLWQVSGKNKLSFQKMVSLDIAYSRKLSLLLDIKILLLTFPTIIGLILEGVMPGFGERQQDVEHKENVYT